MVRRIALLLLAGAAVGCMPVAYQRPETSLAQAETDRRECQAMAQRELFLPFGFGWGPFARRHRLFGDPLLDRMHSESQLADFCMRARGYTLQPVPPPTP